MTYKEYPDHKGCYVIVHYTGYGVMEDPYIEREPVYSTNDCDDTEALVHAFTEDYNTPEQIESTWIPDTFHINVNTITDKGKQLHKEFTEVFEIKLKEVKQDPRMQEMKFGSQTIYFIPMPEFDEPKPKP